MINSKHLRADLIMLLVAIIWGSTFVAQRLGMENVGPFFYSGARFLAGGLLLLPLISWRHKKTPSTQETHFWRDSVILGLVLCIAINMQQVGLQFTSIANAGFITGLYVVLVPVFGMVLRHKIYIGTWLGVILATVGMYFLSVQHDFTVVKGDWFQLVGALAWTVHVLLVGALARRHDPFQLSSVQFITCGCVCLLLSALTETLTTHQLLSAMPALLYGSVLSVGVGFTLQTVAQRDAITSHAAVIFSMEAVFAALFGWWILEETLSARAILGCALMLAGMLTAQLVPYYFEKQKSVTGHT
jgi:drug/metabolite transporter (DMT)-like permease